jgi:hypothetical protein
MSKIKYSTAKIPRGLLQQISGQQQIVVGQKNNVIRIRPQAKKLSKRKR